MPRPAYRPSARANASRLAAFADARGTYAPWMPKVPVRRFKRVLRGGITKSGTSRMMSEKRKSIFGQGTHYSQRVIPNWNKIPLNQPWDRKERHGGRRMYYGALRRGPMEYRTPGRAPVRWRLQGNYAGTQDGNVMSNYMYPSKITAPRSQFVKLANY